MEPIIIHCLFESIEMLANAMNTLREKCVTGITANKEVCRNMVYNSIGLVTALNPYLGYETSTMLAKEALNSGKGIYDLVLEHKLMSKEEPRQHPASGEYGKTPEVPQEVTPTNHLHRGAGR